MKRISLFILCLCACVCIALVSFAQETSAANDTVRVLQEVHVQGVASPDGLPLRSFSAGTHTLKYNEQQLQNTRQQSLSDFLQANSAIYFKEYGKGMAATMALRGTSASQTAVQWNGVNLNMPTMGVMDFSHLPLFFFDEVEIHAGGESAIYGSGSIGGTVELNTSAKYEKGVHGELLQNVGSFGYLFSGALIRVANQRLESRTSAIFNQSDNDYWFNYTDLYGQHREQLKNAAYRNYGLLEEIYFRPTKAHELSIRFWYADFKRQLQSRIANNLIPPYDSIYDRNLRAIASYNVKLTQFKIALQAGYANDYELFRTDVIAAGKAIGSVNAEYTWKTFTIKAGANAEYIKPNVHAYSAGVEEWRNDVFMNLRWLPIERWAVSAGFRQYFVSNVQVPVAPSLGLSYQVMNSPSDNLKLRAAISRNIKIPSLNDLYWGGSMSSLRPEIGWNNEIGADYMRTASTWTLQTSGTVYFNRISDWIRWLPIGVIWRPKNVGIIDAYGAEASMSMGIPLGNKGSFDFSGNYAYTAVVLRESNTTNDPNEGIQVAYQPEHCLNFSAKANYSHAFIQANMRYTGARHSTDQFDIMPSFWLADLSGGYSFHFHKTTLTLLAQCNNLFDKEYQNIREFAMPGRNFNFSLRLQF